MVEKTNLFKQFNEFYRKIFYRCKNYIDNDKRHFCILTGPRKTGKTYCLKQIQNLYSNVVYFNFKTNSDKKSHKNIIETMLKDKISNTIYLLDEITYLMNFDNVMCQSADQTNSFLYTVLLSLPNRISYPTFLKDFSLKLDNIKRILVKHNIEMDTLIESNKILNKLQQIKSFSSNALKEIILFLMECDLINVTHCSIKQDNLIYY